MRIQVSKSLSKSIASNQVSYFGVYVPTTSPFKKVPTLVKEGINRFIMCMHELQHVISAPTRGSRAMRESLGTRLTLPHLCTVMYTVQTDNGPNYNEKHFKSA